MGDTQDKPQEPQQEEPKPAPEPDEQAKADEEAPEEDPAAALQTLAAGADQTSETEDLRYAALQDILEPHGGVPSPDADDVMTPMDDFDAGEETAEFSEVIGAVAGAGAAPKGPGASAAAMAARAAAQQYKRIMIPMLLAVGLILVILSAIAGVLLMGGPADAQYAAEEQAPLLERHGWLVIGIALPVAGVLVLAALHFYRDVRRGGK